VKATGVVTSTVHGAYSFFASVLNVVEGSGKMMPEEQRDWKRT
jgi:hypothetical protein